MKIREEKLTEPVTITGVAATVDKPSAQQTIGALWGQAGQAGALSAPVPSYGVYTAYEDRLANRYRVVVGQPGASGDALEEVTLPAGDYVVFEDHGPTVEVTQRLWQHVWTQWAQRDRRRFDVDFERYEGGPDEATVRLFIGVTPAT